MMESHEMFRIAGEVFGRLRDALMFGELTMGVSSWGPVAGVPAVYYHWTFKAGDQRYAAKEFVSLKELWGMRSTQAFADHLATKWMAQHRQIEEVPA